MPPKNQLIFATQRLLVRTATLEDTDLFLALWTDPRVTRHVGFPQGLPITRAEIQAQLSEEANSEFEQLLVVELKATRQAIGECKLSWPDEEGIAEPDVKLLPEFWGHRYGAEIWRELVAYQFMQTTCQAVQATPNVDNIGSIKMQEAAGAVRTGQGMYEFPESLLAYTAPVQYYIYRLDRTEWERNWSS